MQQRMPRVPLSGRTTEPPAGNVIKYGVPGMCAKKMGRNRLLDERDDGFASLGPCGGAKLGPFRKQKHYPATGHRPEHPRNGKTAA
jgi:hypothetical protein